MSVDDFVDELGESVPELCSTLGIIPTTIGALHSYSQGNIIPAVALALCDIYFGYILYRGILRGGLDERLGRQDSDLLKKLYVGIKSKI